MGHWFINWLPEENMSHSEWVLVGVVSKDILTY